MRLTKCLLDEVVSGEIRRTIGRALENFAGTTKDVSMAFLSRSDNPGSEIP